MREDSRISNLHQNDASLFYSDIWNDRSRLCSHSDERLRWPKSEFYVII